MSKHKGKPSKARVLRALAGAIVLVSAPLKAEDFSFELGLDYDGQRLSTEIPLFTIPGNPISTVFDDTDTDPVGLSGTWYFNGASAAEGPRSRAAFLSRASSLSVSWRRTDISSDFEIDPPIQLQPFPPPPGIITLPPPGTIVVAEPLPLVPDVEGNDYSVSGRYVWADSGWYAFGGVSLGEGDFDTNVGFSADTRSYVIGTGLYLGDRTSIDVALIRSEIDVRIGAFEDDDDATDFALSFTHIGDVGTTWQYGVDAAVFSRDRSSSDTAFALRGSLYPTRSLAFGLEIETEVEAGFDTGTRYALFGSWFVTPQFEVTASYGEVDVDTPPGISADLDVFQVGLLGRF